MTDPETVIPVWAGPLLKIPSVPLPKPIANPFAATGARSFFPAVSQRAVEVELVSQSAVVLKSATNVPAKVGKGASAVNNKILFKKKEPERAKTSRRTWTSRWARPNGDRKTPLPRAVPGSLSFL